jgi:hypothetical protein
MGWAKGTGLGKKSQGMTQPIEVSKQRGRRGLGLQIKGLEAEDVEWDSSREVVNVYIYLDYFIHSFCCLLDCCSGRRDFMASSRFHSCTYFARVKKLGKRGNQKINN